MKYLVKVSYELELEIEAEDKNEAKEDARAFLYDVLIKKDFTYEGIRAGIVMYKKGHPLVGRLPNHIQEGGKDE